MDKGLVTGIIFMDLRKAFNTVHHACLLEKLPCYGDTVHHACLLEKLPCYGITDAELSWFTNYLFNRSQVVSFDNTISEPRSVTHGVLQGSILDPMLFALLINDIYIQLLK